MIGSAGFWRCAGFGICVLIAVTVFVAPDPDASLRSALAIHDFGHVVAFGLATVLFAFALAFRSRATFSERSVLTCFAAFMALTFGATVELAQAVSGRIGDPFDVLRDGGGALSAALILIAYDPAVSVRLRFALAGGAMSTLFAFAYPVVGTLYEEAHARAQFPVLATFETTRELSRFDFGKVENPRIVTITDNEGGAASALGLHLPRGTYPGVELRYFPRDWRGMRALRLLIFNPEPTPIEMSVRIDDAGYDYRLDLSDRYDRSFPLSPGANQIEIPLSDVVAAPRGRQFDLGRVQSVLVYAAEVKEAREIIIGPITLMH